MGHPIQMRVRFAIPSGSAGCPFREDLLKAAHNVVAEGSDDDASAVVQVLCAEVHRWDVQHTVLSVCKAPDPAQLNFFHATIKQNLTKKK